MKKIAFTILIIFSVAFANAQPNAGNINFTNIDNELENNIAQTRSNQNQSNAPISPINGNFFIPNNQEQRTTSQTNRTVRNDNNRTNVSQTATVATRRRTTPRINSEQNQMENIHPIFVLINDNNPGNVQIQNDYAQQNVEENVQRKIALLEISMPKWEIHSQIKPIKTKAVSSSKNKHAKSHSKKHHKKTTTKLARWFKDKGIKNVKANYELCYKF